MKTVLEFKRKLAIYMLGICGLMMTACDEEVNAVEEPLEVQIIENVPADPEAQRGAPPNFTFFDLETGTILTKEDSAGVEWDIALAGVTILTNGGTSGPGQGSALVVNGLFDEMNEAPDETLRIDTEAELAIPGGSGEGWYNYTGNSGTPSFAVIPIPGRVIMLTTGEGNFAKLEILSYYYDNPDTSSPEFADLETRPKSRYYTFRYVVQPNGSTSF